MEGQHEVWKDVEVRSVLWYRQTFWVLPASAAAWSGRCRETGAELL